jgi:hypothetical protein
VGLAVSCRRGGRLFLARTERPSGSASPPFGAGLLRPVIPATCARVSLFLGWADPRKSVSRASQSASPVVVCFLPCRLALRPTRVVLPTQCRKYSFLEAGGSALKLLSYSLFFHASSAVGTRGSTSSRTETGPADTRGPGATTDSTTSRSAGEASSTSTQSVSAIATCYLSSQSAKALRPTGNA